MKNNLPFDMKNYKASEPSKAVYYIAGFIMMIAVLGFMENRDRQHLAEMAQQCERKIS